MSRLFALLRRRPVLGGFAATGALLAVFLLAASLFPGFTLRQAVRILHFATGQHLAFSKARWDSSSSLALLDVAMSGPDPARPDPYFRAKRVEIVWNWAKLPTVRRLRLIEFEEPELTLGKMIAAFSHGKALPSSPSPDEEEVNPFDIVRRVFYKVRIIRGLVWLDDLAPGMPPIPLSIGGEKPLEWSTGSVSRAPEKEDQTQIATANGIRLYAREDQFTPVLDLGHIEIQFTWSGLARKEIAFLSISDPTVFVGPRLFSFVDEFKAHLPPSQPPAAPPAPGTAPAQIQTAAEIARKEWTLKDFALYHLHITVTAFGEPGLTLPFTFNSTAQTISASQLSHLQLKNHLVISAKTFDYPSYGVRLTGLSEKSGVEFNLPPTDPDAENLVTTISMQEASWKEIAAQDAWASVTFDQKGIYGELGGKLYGGYLKGEYHVGFDDGFPWHAELAIRNSEVQEPIAKLAGDHFSLAGKAKVDIAVDARAREILKCEGHLDFPGGGRMAIPSVAEVASRLPPEWKDASFQKQVVTQLLENFRNYRFGTGTVDLRYGVPKSTAELHLDGPAGKRNFILNWTREDGAAALTLPDQKPPRIDVQIDKPTTQKKP